MDRKIMGLTAVLLLSGLIFFSVPVSAVSLFDVDIHGFISQGYIYSDEYNYLVNNSTDGSLEYNEIGINFSKKLTDRLHLGLQLFSRDLGDISNNKVTLDWAYGDYRWKDWLGLRAGRIKLPVGLYNEIRDMDLLRTSIIMPQGIYRDLLRETSNAANGAGLYGNIYLGPVGSLNYQFIGGALFADSESGQEKYTNYLGKGLATQNGESEFDTVYSGSLCWDTPLHGLLLGYSNYMGKLRSPILISDRVPVLGGTTAVAEYDWVVHILSAEYTWSNLVLSFEYYMIDRELESAMINSDTTGLSYYFAASYRFSDWFTLGAYYSTYYPDKDNKDGDNLATYGLPDHSAWERDLAVTFRFDLSQYWVFKLEGHAVDGTANVLPEDNLDTDWNESDWYYGVAKVTFGF